MANTSDETAKPLLIVVGVGGDGKPHAARFSTTEQALVVRAAKLMAFHAVQIHDPALKDAAQKLPEGKVFASGRGFVPFAKRDLYNQFAPLIGTAGELHGEAATSADEESAAPAADAANGVPAALLEPPQAVVALSNTEDARRTLWDAIALGWTVLAYDSESEAWYEAVVVAIAEEDRNALTMKWRDYPSYPLVRSHRNRVSLIGLGDV